MISACRNICILWETNNEEVRSGVSPWAPVAGRVHRVGWKQPEPERHRAHVFGEFFLQATASYTWERENHDVEGRSTELQRTWLQWYWQDEHFVGSNNLTRLNYIVYTTVHMAQ